MDYRKVDDMSHAYNVKSASPVLSTMGFGEVGRRNWQEKKEKEKHLPNKKVKDYFKTLSKATEKSNDDLLKRSMPLRFCVYQKEDLVFMDIAKLNKKGEVTEINTKDITNGDFNQLIDDIANIEGLVIDING